MGSLCVAPTHTSSPGSESDLQPQSHSHSHSQSGQGDDLAQEQPLEPKDPRQVVLQDGAPLRPPALLPARELHASPLRLCRRAVPQSRETCTRTAPESWGLTARRELERAVFRAASKVLGTLPSSPGMEPTRIVWQKLWCGFRPSFQVGLCIACYRVDQSSGAKVQEKKLPSGCVLSLNGLTAC